jgi:hypothetical protein
MSERKFHCPQCNQKISYDASMSGVQIQCPACQKEISIPRSVVAVQVPTRAAEPSSASGPPESAGGGAPAAPKPPAEKRLSVARHEAPAEQAEKPAAETASSRLPTPVPMRAVSNSDTNDGAKRKRLLTVAALVMALGLGAYFGLPAMLSGGEEDGDTPNKTAAQRTDASAAAKNDNDPASQTEVRDSATNSARVAAPVWTMEIKSVSIPEGQAQGTIGGTAFKAEAVRLDPVAQMHLLTLRQGGKMYADREILVYLRLKAGETIDGKSWEIDSSVRPGIPQVVKRWLPDPNRPPQSKAFPSGYAMKLEFGETKDGTLPGKIFVALPDPEKTVVAGTFEAKLPAVTPVSNRRLTRN